MAVGARCEISPAVFLVAFLTATCIVVLSRMPSYEAPPPPTKVVDVDQRDRPIHVRLAIMVANEEETLPRLLRSLEGHVDSYVFCDTGSKDETVPFIKQYVEELQSQGISAQLFQYNFTDFSTSRNRCLRYGRLMPFKGEDYDDLYLLMPDADYELRFARHDWRSHVASDRLLIRVEGDLNYRTPRLHRAARKCEYRRRVHEFLDCPPGTTQELFDLVTIVDHLDGGNRKTKLERELKLIKLDLMDMPNDPRTLFYAGEILHGLGHQVKPENETRAREFYTGALQYYAQRANLTHGFVEETYYARYKMAVLISMLSDEPTLTATGPALDAYAFRPSRAEALHFAAGLWEAKKSWAVCRDLARAAASIPFPRDDYLFISNHVYEWHAEDRYALCSHYAGDSKTALRLWSRILPKVPLNQVERIKANIGYAAKAIK